MMKEKPPTVWFIMFWSNLCLDYLPKSIDCLNCRKMPNETKRKIEDSNNMIFNYAMAFKIHSIRVCFINHNSSAGPAGPELGQEGR